MGDWSAWAQALPLHPSSWMIRSLMSLIPYNSLDSFCRTAISSNHLLDSILQAAILYSGILDTGSRASDVKRLVP